MFTSGSHTDLDHIKEFQSRFKYARPQMVCLSNNQGRYFVNTTETSNVDRLWLPEGTEYEDFLILSDHNRQSVPFNVERLGSNRRMINGHMRTYHTADKLGMSLSWEDIPSRAFAHFNAYDTNECRKFTVDGGAGGLQMYDWYMKHKGSMYVFTSFDNVPTSAVHGNVPFRGYGRVYEMIISDFSFDVKQRSGIFNFNSTDIYAIDMWDVDMALEEV